MPGKKLSRFLGNEKARTQVLSGVVVAIFIISAITGFMITVPKQSAAYTSHGYGNGNYTYTENFDDDTAGSDPTADWYTFTKRLDTGAVAEVDTTQAHGGTKSLKIYGSGTVTLDANFTLNASCDIEYLNFWYYPDQAGQTTFKFMNSTTGWEFARLILSLSSDGKIYFVDKTNIKVEVASLTIDAWNNITVGPWNYTTDMVQIWVGGNSQGWFEAKKDVSQNQSFDMIQITSPLETSDCYFDDFELGTMQALTGGGGGPSLPGTPTGATATAYTKFDITLSGYDGNSRFNFSTFNTNDTAGDTAWSNSTSYGIMKATNDGIQQINLTWTKGTGATNTYIEWNTVSSWSRGAGTLLYNNTGTSATLTDVPAGATRYFEFWSWNASGYSSTYATASATAGNASVTNLTIHMEDGGTGTALLPKENITLYGNGTGTFASLGTFDATTGNITLTTTYAGLPLAIGDSLYFEFKSVIGPGAQPNGTYYDKNAETLDCYVYAWR